MIKANVYVYLCECYKWFAWFILFFFSFFLLWLPIWRIKLYINDWFLHLSRYSIRRVCYCGVKRPQSVVVVVVVVCVSDWLICEKHDVWWVIGLCVSHQCVRAEVKDKANRYFVHYNGWNKKSVFNAINVTRQIIDSIDHCSWLLVGCLNYANG